VTIHHESRKPPLKSPFLHDLLECRGDDLDLCRFGIAMQRT
jgi:hypothetical protein